MLQGHKAQKACPIPLLFQTASNFTNAKKDKRKISLDLSSVSGWDQQHQDEVQPIW